MTQPSHDETTDQQLVLFDLSSQEPINMTSPAFLPQLPTPPPARGKGKKASAPARACQPTNGHSPATLATPTQLEISPRPPLPEILPLLLAGVRAALFQTLAQEAHAIYQAQLTQQPAEQRLVVLLAVEPVRLGASAQLLLDSPALNAAVSLLALGATLTQRTQLFSTLVAHNRGPAPEGAGPFDFGSPRVRKMFSWTKSHVAD
jgi:hypothetical protein